MSLPGQNVQPGRYAVIPRTLSFLIRGSRVLLIELSSNKGAWAGKLNGVGGHIKRGENPRSSALREIREETGLEIDDLMLVGVMMIDTGGSPGIGMYVFVAEVDEQVIISGEEGIPTWIRIDELSDFPLVEDIPFILPRALESYRDGIPFSSITTFDPSGGPRISFLP